MRKALLFLALFGVLATQAVAHAGHGNKSKAHWRKSAVRLVDSVTADWDAALAAASATWNSGLNNVRTVVKDGSDKAGKRRKCPYPKRGVRVCNFAYGTSGKWSGTLGIAQYSYKLPSRHIVRSRIRLNDSVAVPSMYEATTVHEIGHVLGLGHRPQSDETTSCMTPSINPSQISPDEHDFAVVDRRHRHLPHGKAAQADIADSEPSPRSSDPHVRTKRDGDVVHVTWVLPR